MITVGKVKQRLCSLVSCFIFNSKLETRNSKLRPLRAVIIILLTLYLFGCATAPKATDQAVTPSQLETSPEDQSGIQVVSLRTTAAGHFVDFRYRVTDAEKAAAVFDRQNKAYIVDQATGARVGVPRMAKVGPLRQTNFKADPNKVYFIMFDNPAGLLKSGSKVTLEVGDYRLENLTVE